MRRFVLATVLCALCALVLTPSPGRATVTAEVVSETNGEIFIKLRTFPPFKDPDISFFVAIGEDGVFSWDVTFRSFHEVPLSSLSKALADTLRAAAASLTDTVRVSITPPIKFRGTTSIRFRTNLAFSGHGGPVVQWVKEADLHVTYTPSPTSTSESTADPMVLDHVINRSFIPVAARPVTSDPFFSLSSDWIKIPITDRGLYQVTGADLAGLSVSLQSIDPSTIRVYTADPFDQRRFYNDSEASWIVGKGFREVPIVVDGGDDLSFDGTDAVIFYGLGTVDWRDFYDPSAADTVFFTHRYESTNYYYLTWNSALSGTPLRMAPEDATPGGGGLLTTHWRRERREKDIFEALDYGGDGWLWYNVTSSGTNKRSLGPAIVVDHLVASRPQTFRTWAGAQYDRTKINTGHHARYTVIRSGQEVVVGDFIWNSRVSEVFYEDGHTVEIPGNFLVNGSQQFWLNVPRDLNLADWMRFDWFSVSYYRRNVATNNSLALTIPDTTGTVDVRVTGFSTGGTLWVFDVTDPSDTRRLTGTIESSSQGIRDVTFQRTLAADHRHLWATTRAGMSRPSGMRRVSPTDLRLATGRPNMVIVTDASFVGAAERLRMHRERHLPFYDNPTVEVVTTQSIYDNFSGGKRDPMALRNYFKFLYENVADGNNNPTIAYVLLLGDASVDPAQNASTQVDWVPTNIYARRGIHTFATDSWFGHLDPDDVVPGHGIPDVMVGRLPANSVAEADILIDKTIAYELDSPMGDWRNEIILVADDELAPAAPMTCQNFFINDSEDLTLNHVAEYIDVRKVYLTEYQRIGGVKPASRFEFLKLWNEGALLINYIGHGSAQQMADEQVFLSPDVGLLANGLRLPLLVALSCTIGDYANPFTKSMSEKLLLRRNGGVIATLTASEETTIGANSRLNRPLFDNILPEQPTSRREALSLSIVKAKMSVLLDFSLSPGPEDNNWKYNLLTDPALTLRSPDQRIAFDSWAGDTLVAGLRKKLSGSVLKDGTVDTGFNGEVLVKVLEPMIDRVFINDCGEKLNYVVRSGTMFRGTADVVNGRFSVEFRVPRSARIGPRAYAIAYANNGIVDAAAALDSALVLVSPTVADSSSLRPIDGPPRVTIRFRSGLTRVKPGEPVQALVRDADGINILESTNDGTQAVLFDGLTIPVEVNQFFSFDHGGTDTSGVLDYPIPDLSFGKHRMIYKVADSFGQITVDSLEFSITDPLEYTAEGILNFPNPFSTTTQFLFQISDRASIRLDLFTLSGKRIRRIEGVYDGGEVWIPWDGRDAVGEEIANGTYLYVARVDFIGVDRPQEQVRGTVVKIR